MNRLIRGAIQTGLFAGIFSLGDLITFVIVPKTELYAMFVFPIGRIYTNVSVINVTNVCCTMTWTFFCLCVWKTLLDSLLTRDSIRTEMHNGYSVEAVSHLLMSVRLPFMLSLQSGTIGWAPCDSSHGSSTVQPRSFQLQVEKIDLERRDQSS